MRSSGQVVKGYFSTSEDLFGVSLVWHSDNGAPMKSLKRLNKMSGLVITPDAAEHG